MVRPDIIHSVIKILKYALKQACIVAPGQADAQLVKLQKDKYVKYILTNDSDILFLGGDNVIMDFHWDETCFLVTQERIKSVMLKNCVQNSSAAQILSACDVTSTEFATYRAIFATFMGNDFVKSTPKTNNITRDMFFHSFIEASNDEDRKEVIVSAATHELPRAEQGEVSGPLNKRHKASSAIPPFLQCSHTLRKRI